MWSRVVHKCVAPSALAVRRLATDAAAPVSSPGSVAARVGRDVPLVAVPRDARRQARALARRAGASSSTAVVRTTSLPTKISMSLLVGSATGSIAWHFLLDEATKTAITDTLSPTPLGDLYRMVAAKIEELTKPYRDPFKDKLLPDWPIPQVPPNTPPVPVLVLDLEDTLVHSEWSRKHGWRHAKRPGVDEFLDALAQYYEIVVFSNNHLFMAEEIVGKLDRKQAVLHILGREASRYHNSTHVKDLSKLNRDLRQIVLIDDDAAAYQLQPENAIPIRPYTDGRNREDTELKDLIPFLKALANEPVKDFRPVLAEFRDEDGVIRDLPSKYQSRVRQIEIQKEQERQRGLGGFIRGRLSTRPPSMGGQM